MRLICLLALSITVSLALDNGLARTPPMGWMSWTAFYCEMNCQKHPHACINEQLYMDMADRMAADGYLAVGYKGVHVDDCWMDRQRDAAGRLVSDPQRFPSGMKSLAKYMHDRGLTFGIYEDYGTKTCAGFPGSYGFLQMDAQSFADWDVDYLKLDGCNINLDLMPVGYPEMARALNATGRPIVYSCSWPAYLINQPQKVDYNVIGEYCNLWRNFDDINSSWKSIMSIISYYDHMQDKHIPTHGPGKWHDPDMLVIGNAGITPDMARAQMTIWCIWSAPLIMSNDLRNIAPVFRDILQNKAVIAVDQDPLGKMGRLVANTTDVGVYLKPMTPVDSATGETSFAIGILNRNPVNRNSVEFVLGRLGLSSPGGYRIDDLWTGQLVGVFRPTDSFQTVVNPTGANMFKATPVALANLKGLRFATFK
ncbi:hypothetical protein PFISCL1PPCAC_2278 [Pristionchus fissidentatus]|uniref:Alpha-galactosidase n=1 Tax=Pristionchus fissidentatus TaxID=1538716 RepID=A0AAV5UUL6_9BILA|nr:hypothetical protein PFISCL1PPCAC_2278 [Pristionchus fissidentatus]